MEKCRERGVGGAKVSGADGKLNIDGPEGVLSRVRPLLAVLSGTAEEGETDVQEVGDGTLLGGDIMEATPKYVEDGEWYSTDVVRGGQPVSRYGAGARAES